jgi:hypothetical protein
MMKYDRYQIERLAGLLIKVVEWMSKKNEDMSKNITKLEEENSRLQRELKRRKSK